MGAGWLRLGGKTSSYTAPESPEESYARPAALPPINRLKGEAVKKAALTHV
jgi:hypothetical protein